MSILVRFSPPSMTAEQYDAIVERLYKEGVHPERRSILHGLRSMGE